MLSAIQSRAGCIGLAGKRYVRHRLACDIFLVVRGHLPVLAEQGDIEHDIQEQGVQANLINGLQQL